MFSIVPVRVALSPVTDIYLLCTEADVPVAGTLSSALSQEGWSVSHSRDPSLADAELACEARCVVVLWSLDAVNDPVVINEAGAAFGRKRLTQALIEDVRAPRRFKRSGLADIVDWDRRAREDPGLRDLVAAVGDILDRPEDESFEPLGYEEPDERSESTPTPEGNLFGGGIIDLEDHTGEVYDLAVAPDGKIVASASEDGRALLWDVDEPAVRTELNCGSEVSDVAFSPDGLLVLTASNDGAVRIWRSSDGQQRHQLDHHDGNVYWAAFSPRGDLAASAGSDARVVVWRAEGLQVVWEFEHDDEVPTARFLPDGTVLATADDEGDVTLWDLESGDALRVIDAHDEAITDIAVSPDGTWLATASAQGNLSVWNLADASLQWWSGEIAGAVYGMCFSPDGTLLAESDDEGISLWTAHDGDLVDFITDPNATRLEFSPVGNRLAWASDDAVRIITGRS